MKRRLVLLCLFLALVITAIYFRLYYTQDNYDGSTWSTDRCFTELTSTKYQLNVVTEYKNRIDKLLTETEKRHRTEKERFKDIMESCIALKQQSAMCQNQFEDLQSECKKIREDYDKLSQDMEKALKQTAMTVKKEP